MTETTCRARRGVSVLGVLNWGSPGVRGSHILGHHVFYKGGVIDSGTCCRYTCTLWDSDLSTGLQARLDGDLFQTARMRCFHATLQSCAALYCVQSRAAVLSEPLPASIVLLDTESLRVHRVLHRSLPRHSGRPAAPPQVS